MFVIVQHELVSKAVEIKLRAKQRTVEMVQEGQKKGDLRSQKDGQSRGNNPVTPSATLKEVGLSKQEVQRWKPLAIVTERQLEKTCEVVLTRFP